MSMVEEDKEGVEKRSVVQRAFQLQSFIKYKLNPRLEFFRHKKMCKQDFATLERITEEGGNEEEKQKIEKEFISKYISTFFSHQHPITLVESNRDDKQRCFNCGDRIFHESFGCPDCKIFLHQSCARKGMQQIMTEVYDQKRRIDFFRHNHPITCIAAEEGKYICYNCDHSISLDNDIFGCRDCKIFLEESCARKGLCLKIRHYYHPHHPLKFETNFFLDTCSACGKFREKKDEFLDYVFSCEDCGFFLCMECLFLQPNIKHGSHEHVLTFFHKLNRPDFRCNSCGLNCEQFVYRCVNCDLNFHLSCFPSFPRTIKAQCHIDSLTLITDPDLVESDKGYDEFYCDVCEKLRDPKDPVYCCAPCSFVAHIQCVFSEVMSSLSTDEGEMKIPPVEKYLADIIGDEAMARRFFAELRVKKIGEATEVMKYKNPSFVNDLGVEIEKLHDEIRKQTEISETANANVKALNEKLEEAKGQREKFLRLHGQI